jgi:hypothetical protein
MAVTVSKIHVGPARVFAGVTAGATGTPPTYITHTAGVPGTGTDLGATTNDAIFTYQLVKKEINIEQELAPVDVFSSDEMASIEFECLEQTYVSLQTAFDIVGSETIAGGDAFWFGGGTAVLAPRTQTIFLSSMQRNAPTKFILAVLYKAYSVDGIKLNASKQKPTTYKVKIQGLSDLTRNAGDRVGYFRFEK